MNKEQEIEIEEMANILLGNAKGYCDEEGAIIAKKLAKSLYSVGYRKVYPLKLCDGKSFELTDEDTIAEQACEDCRRQTERETAHRICIKLLLLYSKINKGRTNVDIIKHDLTAILLNISSAYQIEMPEVFPRR